MNLIYWISRFGLVFFVILTGALFMDVNVPYTDFLIPLMLLGLPFFIVGFLISTPSVTTAMKVWKWITGITSFLTIGTVLIISGPALVSWIFNEILLHETYYQGVGFVVGFILYIGVPPIFISILGVVISEFLSKNRS